MTFSSGLGCALGAAIAYGVQYVPVKKYDIYDGMTFQWFMCSGVLMAGFIIAICFQEVEKPLPLQVVLGGMMWTFANYCVSRLVGLLGIGLGFSLYQFVNLMVGYATGRLGLFGLSKLEGNLQMCDLGCGLILLSFVIMNFVQDSPVVEEMQYDAEAQSLPAAVSAVSIKVRARSLTEGLGSRPVGHIAALGIFGPSGSIGSALNEAGSSAHSFQTREDGGMSLPPPTTFEQTCNDGPVRATSSPALATPLAPPPSPGTASLAEAEEVTRARSPIATKLLGVALALLSGGVMAMQSVPASLYLAAHPEASQTSVVLPQCLGVWICSTAMYMLYASLAWLMGWSVPHSVIRPAFISGCIWALGFFFMIGAIAQLGYSVGYSMDAVLPIVISSLLSIIVFREIRGRRQLGLYMASLTFQIAGTCFIAFFGKSS
mmetsp:Transcript_101836/g.263767  ORF Transcript_101836/g.263767 Transcript_101836/m.263767 type:complete len:431 (-) Transcript_101836:208-1500(-)